MARKRKPVKKSPKKRQKREKIEEEEEERQGLSPQTKRLIAGFTLLVLGVVSLLAFVDLAGPVGRILEKILTLLFGGGYFLIPFVILWLAYLTFKGTSHERHSIHYWGLSLLILSLYGLLHWTEASPGFIGLGGGYVGMILSWPILKIFGSVAGIVVLFALFIVSILLLFDGIIDRLFGEHNIFRQGYMNARHSMMSRAYSDDHDEEPDEEDEEEDDETETEEEAEGDTEADEGTDEETSDEAPSDSGDSSDDGEQEKLFTPPRRRLPKINMPVELLSGKTSKPNSGDIRANQEIILRTLQNFGISVEMGEVNVGPTVTQYTLRPAEGVKLTQITTLQNDIALALAAHPIRIEAPIPGKSLVGIEVPNKSVAIVTLRELIDSSQFKKNRSSHLSLAIGKDVAGIPYLADLDRMPHMLVAGATGSGKSIAINAIIISLIYQNQPNDLKFILVDPKRVELTTYKNIPYLLTPVITDVKKTVSALRWAVKEMDRRYDLLSRKGYRNIASYNAGVGNGDKLPYIVIIIDELADLMAVAANDVEAAIVRLAQMARAIGIHLIVATQRPSVDVITGLIKANITSRVAFSVASLVDSRTILDNAGAEKLLGRGDMLFISAELSKPKRLQGSYVSDRDIESVANYLREKAKPDYLDEVTTLHTGADGSGGGGSDADDPLLDQAKEVILQAQKASASLLQRRLRVGYARAARLLDILEEMGFIGPADGAKPREILYDPELDEAEEVNSDDEYEHEDGDEDEDDSYDSVEEEEEIDDGAYNEDESEDDEEESEEEDDEVEYEDADEDEEESEEDSNEFPGDEDDDELEVEYEDDDDEDERRA